jgi:predicted flap endonuclease-1-like 5' DNA nuclease
MPPKNKKKNKGTKFVVAGEEVLNMSGVGKAITNNLNESGILSAGK